MALHDSRIAFIGSGSMAEAMLGGLLREELIPPTSIIAAGPRSERGHTLETRYGVGATTHNDEAAAEADIVVLSVKPQVMPTVLAELHGHIRPEALVLSIAAGVTIADIATTLAHPAIVRAMPNTPAQIGLGITVWVDSEPVTEQQKTQAASVLGALGETVYVEHESYLDMATALSGTGPAYVLLVMEAMIDAGVHLGFSRRIAEALVTQTMLGTVEYARRSGKHPATLRNEVTSPGGTSAEALFHMEDGGLRTVLARAVWAAYRRSVALGSGDPTHLDGRNL
jgi:pyrroline-5-carboxylate reductase